MSFFDSLEIAVSALKAERLRVDLASANLANANATRSAEGGPYRRRDAVLQSVPQSRGFGTELQRAVQAVRIRSIVLDGVFHHTGMGFFAFKDVMTNGERSEYTDWYFLKGYPVRGPHDPNYACWNGHGELPKLNLESKAARSSGEP